MMGRYESHQEPCISTLSSEVGQLRRTHFSSSQTPAQRRLVLSSYPLRKSFTVDLSEKVVQEALVGGGGDGKGRPVPCKRSQFLGERPSLHLFQSKTVRMRVTRLDNGARFDRRSVGLTATDRYKLAKA